MKKYKRFYVTFIEIFIGIAILSLTIGLIGLNIRDLIKEQRFKSEVALVVDQLRLAQDMMLILNADVTVKFNPDKQGIRCSLETGMQLSPGWKKEIKRQRPNLKAISVIEFQDHANDNKSSHWPLELQFLSGGSLMSQGVLHLANQDSTMEVYVCFPGYPAPIFSITDPKDPHCNFHSQANFFERLTFHTRREIEERLQK
jgi:Tfp pilus assembly protein FimT